jgi:hypothetical protein
MKFFMKYTLLYIFSLFSITIFSQNAVAELKFEEAETAFNNGNYDLTLQKVDEFEGTLGDITDKSLYLRVVSQNKLFNPTIFYTDENQFTLYISLTANATKYLKATENNGLNDKFKEVYAINENLKKLNLPKDKATWQKENQRIEKEERDKQSIKLAQIEQCKKAFKELTIDDLPFGITIEEFQKQYPNVLGENPKKKGYKYWDSYYSKNNVSIEKYSYSFEKFQETDHNIIVTTDLQKDSKICSYIKVIYFYKGKENKQSEFNTKRNELLEKYKYLTNCADPHNSGTEFSVSDGNKIIFIKSTIEDSNYLIYINVTKKL